MMDDVECRIRIPPCFLGGGFELTWPHFDDGELGRDEEGIEQQEKENSYEIKNRYAEGRELRGDRMDSGRCQQW